VPFTEFAVVRRLGRDCVDVESLIGRYIRACVIAVIHLRGGWVDGREVCSGGRRKGSVGGGGFVRKRS